jgi:hypothetical protein
MKDDEVIEHLEQLKAQMQNDPVLRAQFFHLSTEARFLCEFPVDGCETVANWRRPPSAYYQSPMYACNNCVERLK